MAERLKISENIKEELRRILGKVGLVTTDDIEELRERIEKLEKKVSKKSSTKSETTEVEKEEKICIATRNDGKPCTAKARPGSEYCVAHRRLEK